jgi:dTDP-4-dehydrorhamnose reductase
LRVVVTGAGGQLGTDLVALAAARGAVQGFTRADLDLTHSAQVRAVLRDQAAAADRLVVINAAAYTKVDAAETDEAGAYAGNAVAPATLAAACAEVGARLVHVSTDYVFPGDATDPYDVDSCTGGRSGRVSRRSASSHRSRGWCARRGCTARPGRTS